MTIIAVIPRKLFMQALNAWYIACRGVRRGSSEFCYRSPLSTDLHDASSLIENYTEVCRCMERNFVLVRVR